MNARQHKPAVRLTETVHVGRVETLEAVQRLLETLDDLYPQADQKRPQGIVRFRVREAIQKTKVQPKGRIMP